MEKSVTVSGSSERADRIIKLKDQSRVVSMHNVSLHKTREGKKCALAFYKWLSSFEVKFSRDDYADLTHFVSAPWLPL